MKKNTTTEEKYQGCENALWIDPNDNELVLVARGSGENIDEDEDMGVIPNAAPFYGMDGNKLFDRWCACDEYDDDFYRYVIRHLRKLAKTADAQLLAEIKSLIPARGEYPCNLSDKWGDWREDNVKPYDCETYALVFNLATMPNGEAVKQAMLEADKHEIDIYPTGFSIDGKEYDETLAEMDGGLQTTFEASTPSVCDRKQLKESLGMCGYGKLTKKQLACYKIAYAC